MQDLSGERNNIQTAPPDASTVAQIEVGVGEPLAVPAPDPIGGRPTVTLCGSMRFLPLMLDVAAELSSKGAIVLMPYKVIPPGEQGGAAKAALDQLHRDKIDRSSSVVVVTDPTGYVGESTRGEISYAIRSRKPVTLCRRKSDTSTADQRPEIDPDWDFLHEVSWWEWLVGDVLKLRVPYSRCGVRLVGDPARPDPIDSGAPPCPRCARRR